MARRARTAVGSLLLASFLGQGGVIVAAGGSGLDTRGSGGPPYFGYVGVDCGTSYLAEVSSFTNLDHTCVYDTSDVTARLEAFADADVKAFVDLHSLFFEEAGPPGASGVGFELRPDYVARWKEFARVNRSVLDAEHVGAFYIAEEPTWLGLTTEDVRSAAELVEADLPSIPLAIVEAHQALGDLEVPTVIDWVGMDFYGAIDPTNSDANSQFAWLNELWSGYYAALKSRRSRDDQQIVVIFDAQYSDAYAAVGYTEESLAEFVENYHRLLRMDDDVVALLGYVYFSGLDPGTVGLRDLPRTVIDANREVGAAITGKPAVTT